MKLVPGLDGRKMSKSYDNHIPLFLESPKMRKLIMKIKTDSLPPEAPKDPSSSIIFDIFKEFASESEVADLKARYEKGIGWGEAKEALFNVVEREVQGARSEYQRWMNNRDEIDRMLEGGAREARVHAQQLLRKIRVVTGIDRP
jgi:tryptophanyl-tRNA synthetase